MSNTFWIILMIAGIGIMVLFFFSDKNSSVSDLLMMPFLALALAVPFAIALTVLLTRLGAHVISGLIYGAHQEPEKEKYGKARIFIVEEKFEKAIDEFRRILEENPGDFYSRQQIAEIYAEKIKDYPKAVEEYNKLLEMNAGEKICVTVLNRLADIYDEKLNERGKAIDSLKLIINRYPDSSYSKMAMMRLEKYGI